MSDSQVRMLREKEPFMKQNFKYILYLIKINENQAYNLISVNVSKGHNSFLSVKLFKYAWFLLRGV